MGPEQIAREVYTDLPLESVYATILYYLHNKSEVEAYLEQGERIADAWYQEYLEKGPYFLRDEAKARIARPRRQRAAGSREQAETTGGPMHQSDPAVMRCSAGAIPASS